MRKTFSLIYYIKHDISTSITWAALFLDAIASQEIVYIQVTTLIHHRVEISFKVRQSKDVRKKNISIIAITAILTNRVSMAIAAITASTGSHL